MTGQDGRGPDWQLIARYLSGRCSEKERLWLDMWAVADPGNERLLGRARRIWSAAGEPGYAALTAEEAHADWERLKARRAHAQAAEPNPPDPASSASRQVDEPMPPEL